MWAGKKVKQKHSCLPCSDSSSTTSEQKSVWVARHRIPCTVKSIARCTACVWIGIARTMQPCFSSLTAMFMCIIDDYTIHITYKIRYIHCAQSALFTSVDDICAKKGILVLASRWFLLTNILHMPLLLLFVAHANANKTQKKNSLDAF